MELSRELWIQWELSNVFVWHNVIGENVQCSFHSLRQKNYCLRWKLAKIPTQKNKSCLHSAMDLCIVKVCLFFCFVQRASFFCCISLASQAPTYGCNLWLGAARASFFCCSSLASQTPTCGCNLCQLFLPQQPSLTSTHMWVWLASLALSFQTPFSKPDFHYTTVVW